MFALEVSMLVSEDINRMAQIILMSTILKIFEATVRFVSILALVIDFKSFGSRSYESRCDQRMNVMPFVNFIFDQNQVRVSSTSKTGLHRIRIGLANGSPIINPRRHALYAAFIADFVESFITYDWPPRLHRLGILA